MRIVILSPHCDDAPLSLGAALLERRLGPRPIAHIFFSTSAFTLTNRGQRSWREVTALRKGEEQLASQLASYAPTFWDLPEAFLRPGFSRMAQLFDLTRDPRADPAYVEVSAIVERVLSSDPDLVLSPLGCGNHIDHRLVRDAAIDACQRDCASGRVRFPKRLGFYEDLPYAGRLTPSRIEMYVAALSSALIPVSVGIDSIKAKNTLLTCYGSQLGARDFAIVASHASQVGGERLWIPTHSVASFLASPDAANPKIAPR